MYSDFDLVKRNNEYKNSFFEKLVEIKWISKKKEF